MRIAVISPYANNSGRTTLSMLLGMELSKTNKVCMCHTKPISESIYDYLGLNEYVDKTSTPSQIVKILKEGGLDKDSIHDYCKAANDNFEVFTNNTTNFTSEDMQYMLKYIVKEAPHEHIIIDVDNEDAEFNKEIIDKCDVAILCINQSIKDAKQFKKNREEFTKLVGDKPLIVVVNKFNSSKGTLAELAKWMGIKKPNGWIVMHENPWITWATNHGKVANLFKLIMRKDIRVIELNSELAKIATTLVKAKAKVNKSRGGGRR